MADNSLSDPAQMTRKQLLATVESLQRQLANTVNGMPPCSISHTLNFCSTVFDEFPSLLWIAGPDGVPYYFNRTWLTFTGRSLTQEQEHGWEEGIHPDDIAIIQAGYQQARLHHEPSTQEYRLRHHDGSHHWLIVNIRPLPNHDGGFAGFMGIGYDITDRKLAEDALQESEARFRNLLEHVQLIAVCLATDGTITFCNDYLLNLTGWQRHEVLLHNWFDLFVPDSHGHVRQVFHSCINEGSIPSFFENDILVRSGERRFISWNNTLLRNPGGAVIGTASIGMDLTEHKRAENELAHYQSQLEALMAERSQVDELERRRFASALHDGIGQDLAFSKIRLKSLIHCCQVQEHWPIFNDVIASLDRAIAEVRSLTFQLSPPLLYEVGFDAAVEWLGEHFSDKFAIGFDFCTTLPPKPVPEDVAISLYQIMRELLVNIVKHAAASSFRIALAEKNGNLSITVEDNGVGFAVDTATHSDVTTGGYGLFNVRQHLQFLRGEMKINSRKGDGTRITISVPAWRLIQKSCDSRKTTPREEGTIS